jgi:hypothetical protein
MVVKNKITGRFDVLINQRNTEESSRLFDCDKMELAGNHIMIYKKNNLVFKVWLKYDKWESYENLEEAMMDVGIRIYKFK